MSYRSIIISTLCISTVIPTVLPTHTCTTPACAEQLKFIVSDIDLNVDECADFYKLACKQDKASQHYGRHIVETWFMWEAVEIILAKEESKNKTKDRPLLAEIQEEYAKCVKKPWPSSIERCWQALPWLVKLGALHLKINQNLTREGGRSAKLLGDQMLEGLKQNISLFRIGKFLPKRCEFLTKILPSLRVEVGYPGNFDQLEHIDYLNESSIGKVEQSYDQGDRIKPLPYWPVDFFPPERHHEDVYTYHNESNTIYIPLSYLLSKLFFREEAPEVYNYAALGTLIVRAVMKEYFKSLKAEGIYTRDPLVFMELTTVFQCIKKQTDSLKDFRPKSKAVMTDEVVDDIIIDTMTLRAAYEAFKTVPHQTRYEPLAPGRFDDIPSQFFLFSARTFCWDREDSPRLWWAYPNLTTIRDYGYHRVIIPLRNVEAFEARYNCGSGNMSHTACIS